MHIRMKTDADALKDKVYAAMETGNHAQARLVLAEHRETYEVEVKRITREVQQDYGIRL